MPQFSDIYDGIYAPDDFIEVEGNLRGRRKILLGTQLESAIEEVHEALFGAGTAADPKLAVGTAGNGIYASQANYLDFTTNGLRSWQITDTGVLQHYAAGTIGSAAGTLTVQALGSNVIDFKTNGSIRWEVGSASASLLSPTAGVVGSTAGDFTVQAGGANTLNLATNGSTQWSISSAGVLNSTGASTLGTATGNLTISTGAGNGNILIVPHGTGGVKIGNSVAPVTLFHVSNTSTSNPRGIMSAQYSTSTDSAQFHTRKGRGTEASPTVVVTGDYLGRYVASGYDGTTYLEMGSIAFQVTGTVGSNRVPTQIVFSTATDASTSVRTDYVWIKPDGKTGIGTSTPATELHVSSTSTSSVRGLMMAQYSTGTDGARVFYRKARGTEASPTVVVTGDVLGYQAFDGYDGSNYLLMANCRVEATGTIASTRVPTRMVWATATDALPSVLTDRMTLASDGRLTVGTFTASTSAAIGGGSGSAIVLSGGMQADYAFGPAYKVTSGNGSGPTGFGIATGSASPFWLIGFPTGGTKLSIGSNTSGFTTTPTSIYLTIDPSTSGVGINTTVPGSFGLAINHATGQCLHLIYNDSDGSPVNHAALTVSSGGNLTITPSGNQTIFSGTIITAVQSLSGAGAVNVTQFTTALTSTGVADALTLANGTVGQIKVIIHAVDGGSSLLTPTTPLGYSTITFTNAGDTVTLQYVTQGWAVIGSKGAVIA